jgi:hypothetical protein
MGALPAFAASAADAGAPFDHLQVLAVSPWIDRYE